MKSYSIYKSPIGDLLLTSENNHLIGLTFIDKENQAINDFETHSNDILSNTSKWLDQYFSSIAPTINIDISLNNCTDFQKIVLEETMKIPYGKTITYKEILERVKERKHINKMSCQAIGQALKRNPIAIIIPCHRVVGDNNKLTGYAFGLDKKEFLLKLEKETKR